MTINIQRVVNFEKAKGLVKPLGNIVLNSAFRFASRAKNRTHNYAVYNNGNFVGFALLSPENNKSLYLNLIVTKPKKGYGSLLLNRIKSNARNQGFRRINLNSVNEARNFYNKMGFRVVGGGSKYSFNL
jgi:N-acetylglutamate synthase-like GNAT family acetyltransferase